MQLFPEQFTAIVFPNANKVSRVTKEGISEYLLRAKVDPGIWIFKENGIIAKPVCPAEPHDKTSLFDNLELPQVGVLPVMKTSVWFSMPLNENQYRKHVRAKKPLPLFFAPDTISIFDPILARVYKHRRTLLLYEDINERYPLEQIEKLRHGFETWRECGAADLYLPKELHKAFQLAVESDVPPLERLAKYCLGLVSAQLQSLTDLGNGQYRIGYNYQGHSDSVTINDNLTVLDAGICLDGHDRDFDLASIVPVKARAPASAR